MKHFSVLVILIMLLSPGTARAEDPDGQFLQIYRLIEKADALRESGQSGPARTKYEQAQTELLNLKKSEPTWNPKVISFRLNYVAENIATLSQTNAPNNSATASPETKAETKTATSASTQQQAKLLDPGAEPRRVLRLTPKAGDKQSLAMTIKMAMEMGMGDAAGQPIKMPAMEMILDVTVKSISADGDIAYEMVMADVKVADEPDIVPQMAEAMKASLAGVKGLSSTGTMSNRGHNKGTEIKLPANADPQMRQSMEQMKESLASVMAPLPDEAVGPGAKWEVKLPLKSQGMTFNQTATYQLTSIEGDRLNMSVSLVQHAANQKMQNPAMPGLKADLTKMTGSGTGNVRLDLANLLPSLATINSHTEMSMGMNVGGQKQNMAMKMDMDMRLEAK